MIDMQICTKSLEDSLWKKLRSKGDKGDQGCQGCPTDGMFATAGGGGEPLLRILACKKKQYLGDECLIGQEREIFLECLVCTPTVTNPPPTNSPVYTARQGC